MSTPTKDKVTLSEQELSIINKKFREMDIDGDGVISLNDYIEFKTRQKGEKLVSSAKKEIDKVSRFVKRKTSSLKNEHVFNCKTCVDKSKGEGSEWMEVNYVDSPSYLTLKCYDLHGKELEDFNIEYSKIVADDVVISKDKGPKIPSKYSDSWSIEPLKLYFCEHDEAACVAWYNALKTFVTRTHSPKKKHSRSFSKGSSSPQVTISKASNSSSSHGKRKDNNRVDSPQPSKLDEHTRNELATELKSTTIIIIIINNIIININAIII
eukprot:TRINITY_DN3156_c0_g4_i2.p1 TRINITY_DN3156_c0_g4~~TRINITY_DN3156_c0_g4_i2.p1  ORF type:complete len:267 (-),score=52.77 TRINITY_DN3156_c0_g4_i2:614-1414(-)